MSFYAFNCREQQSPHALPRASATMSVHVEAIAVPCVIKKGGHYAFFVNLQSGHPLQPRKIFI